MLQVAQAAAEGPSAGGEAAVRAAHEATLRRLRTCEAPLAASHAFRSFAKEMKVSSSAQHRRHKVISRHVRRRLSLGPRLRAA